MIEGACICCRYCGFFLLLFSVFVFLSISSVVMITTNKRALPSYLIMLYALYIYFVAVGVFTAMLKCVLINAFAVSGSSS